MPSLQACMQGMYLQLDSMLCCPLLDGTPERKVGHQHDWRLQLLACGRTVVVLQQPPLYPGPLKPAQYRNNSPLGNLRFLLR